jgi:hypothetical protein
LSRHLIGVGIALAAAAVLGGCSNGPDLTERSNWFSKPVDMFATPDWAKSADANTAALGPKGAVAPNDLVNADGSCAPAEAPPVAAAAAPQSAPVATASADPMGGLQTGPGAGPGMGPAGAPVLGGIALGMSECEAVRRAGQPSHVAIGAGEKGERKVVVTYTGGNLPGIYTFYSGRLKEIAAAPAPEKPKHAPKKKKPVKRANSAAHQPERVYVQ